MKVGVWRKKNTDPPLLLEDAHRERGEIEVNRKCIMFWGFDSRPRTVIICILNEYILMNRS